MNFDFFFKTSVLMVRNLIFHGLFNHLRKVCCVRPGSGYVFELK